MNGIAPFVELVQVALGHREKLPIAPSDEMWRLLFSMSIKQAVAGVVFPALEKISSQGQRPPSELLYDWIGFTEHIKERNKLLTDRCIQLTYLFKNAGFDTCILKGQGNSLMYPNPLLRMSGDIDIWVNGYLEDTECSDRVLREKIVRFCQTKANVKDDGRYHFKFPIFDDVIVEVHFVPSYMRNPRYTKRAEKYFKKCPCFKETIGYKIPSIEYNLVFQMSHMMRHFFYGGIGLRQVMDYYYLLNSDERWTKEIIQKNIRFLGMDCYAGAVMWVLQKVFCIDEKKIYVPVDKRRGEFLLNEILKSGNFGHYDQRLFSRYYTNCRIISVVARNARMIKYFPIDAICAPIIELEKYIKACCRL